MKIALFCDSYAPYVSGVVRSVQRLTKGLTALGHQVYIFAPMYQKTPSSQEACDAAKIFRYFSIPAPTCKEFAISVPFSPKTDVLLRKIGVQIIHSHSPFMLGRLGAYLARKNQIPLVFTHHTLYHEYVHYLPVAPKLTRQMIVKFLQGYCRRCDTVISPTYHVEELIRSLYESNTPVTSIPTGVDTSFYSLKDPLWLKKKLQIPEGAQTLLFVGRLGQEKNVELVLDTFFLLAEEFPFLHLTFVGDGPERARLTKKAEEKRLLGRVHFTGTLNAKEVVHAYQGAYLFVFASITETQGLVTLEAMAAGLPVIGVDATGTKDMVVCGKNGYLTKENAADLAKRTRELLLNQSLYEELKQGALLTAKNYSLESIAQQHLKLYQELLRKRGDTPKVKLFRYKSKKLLGDL